ncbi:VIT1/CCC1 transporter family protein [Candidatus Micrarchaeota archaeon]|nr:VIT1/CCC1 transporter family protein [Candidatus Micrarchaeota archaeon]
MKKEKDPQEEHLIAGPEVKDFVLGVNDGLVSIVALVSVALTGLFLFCVGAVKGKLTKINPFYSGFEMLVIGTIAALVTYYAGTFIGIKGA